MKSLFLISIVLLATAAGHVAAQAQTPAKAKTKWVYLHLSTSSGSGKYGPLVDGGQQWKGEVPRKVPMLLITKPFEVPDNGWDACMEADFSRQFAAHLLSKHRPTLMKLQFHRTLPIQRSSHRPDLPASVRDYESWKSQKGRTVGGVPFEVVEISDFKFQTMAKYPCIRDDKLNAELAKIIGNGIL